MHTFQALLDEEARRLIDSGLAAQWIRHAILPSEMAFFLAQCNEQNITYVVESGRQDGYSTEVLGRWASEKGARVVSIDTGFLPDRDAASKVRVQSLPVDCRNGDAFDAVGKALFEANGRRTALLIDGPKRWPALMLLSAASCQPHVRVLALHNLDPGSNIREWATSNEFRFYEDFASASPTWQQLLAIGRECRLHVPEENADQVSLLGVRSNGRTLPWHRHFGFGHPILVSALWRSGAYGTGGKVMRNSSRWFS
jgi:hypothetical protein